MHDAVTVFVHKLNAAHRLFMCRLRVVNSPKGGLEGGVELNAPVDTTDELLGTTCETKGNTMQQVTKFYFWQPKFLAPQLLADS
jgi:hypothetical protein